MMIQYYVINRLVRSVSAPLDKDRFLSPDIDAVTKLLQDEKVGDYTQCNKANNSTFYRYSFR